MPAPNDKLIEQLSNEITALNKAIKRLIVLKELKSKLMHGVFNGENEKVLSDIKEQIAIIEAKAI